MSSVIISIYELRVYSKTNTVCYEFFVFVDDAVDIDYICVWSVLSDRLLWFNKIRQHTCTCIAQTSDSPWIDNSYKVLVVLTNSHNIP